MALNSRDEPKTAEYAGGEWNYSYQFTMRHLKTHFTDTSEY